MSSYTFKADKFEYCKIQCVCIKSSWDWDSVDFNIQEGNIYNCEAHPALNYYSVTTDNKYYGVHEKKWFIPLAEWRQQQIDKILDGE